MKTKEILVRSMHVYFFATFIGEVLSNFSLQVEIPISFEKKRKPIKTGVFVLKIASLL